MYRTTHSERLPAETGFEKTVTTYEDIIDTKTGNLKTVEKGKEPFYQKIQENKETSTLEYILKRYQIDIDGQKITEVKDEIVDLTTAPQDLIEVYALTHKLQNIYEKIPAEMKTKYNDFGGFLKAYESGQLQEDLTRKQETPKPETPKKEEMNNGE